MKISRSKFASKKYPNLFKYLNSPCWVFRKYCKEKRREFIRSTGESSDEARAYKKGLEMFNQWLGTRVDHSRMVLVRDIARAVLSAKEGKRESTYRSSRAQLVNHILPYFGHLRPDQVTALRWNQYDVEERRKGQRTKLFNSRKALLEIMNRAKEEGLIGQVPKFKNHDSESRLGQYIDDLTVQRILNSASPDTRLLIETIYRMGARPGEILKWEYGMIRWEEDLHGRIYIPGRITKTGRSRDIPLNSRISQLLKARLEEDSPSKFIFPSPTHPDRPVSHYKTGWIAACRRSGVQQEIRLYDMRHTWVTNQAKRGINVLFTAKYADTSVAMIERVYIKAESTAMQGVAG